MIIAKAIMFFCFLILGISQQEVAHKTDTTLSYTHQKIIQKGHRHNSSRKLLSSDTYCRTRLTYIPSDFAVVNEQYVIYLENFVEVRNCAQPCAFSLDSLEWSVKEDGKNSLPAGLSFYKPSRYIVGAPETVGYFEIAISVYNPYCNDTSDRIYFLYVYRDQRDTVFILSMTVALLLIASATCCIALSYKIGCCNKCCGKKTIVQAPNNQNNLESSKMIPNRPSNEAINFTTIVE